MSTNNPNLKQTNSYYDYNYNSKTHVEIEIRCYQKFIAYRHYGVACVVCDEDILSYCHRNAHVQNDNNVREMVL